MPQCRNSDFVRFFALICGMLMCALAFAGEAYLFSPVELGGDVSDRELRSISQLPDGRMVFVTEESIYIYDGVNHDSYRTMPDGGVCRLPGYDGFTHIYIEGDSLLWYKNRGRLSCLNWRDGFSLTADDMSGVLGGHGVPDDLFVDNGGCRWICRGDSLVSASLAICMRSGAGMLQDVASRSDTLYMFFDDGKVDAYALTDGSLKYTVAAYGDDELDDFRNTSLVVADDDGFYQLRTGRMSGLFYFDSGSRCWSRLLDAGYTLNTLALGPAREVMVSCQKGLWIIDPINGDNRYMDYIHVSSGNNLATEISSVFVDKDGGIWLGTFNRGILYTHPSGYECISIKLPEVLKSRRPEGFCEDRFGRVYLYGDGVAYLVDVEENTISDMSGGMSAVSSYHTGYDGGNAFSAFDGTEYFLGADAVTVFKPGVPVTPVPRSYAPLLTGINVNGDRLDVRQESADSVSVPYASVCGVELDYGHGFVTFEYSVLNYSHASGVGLKYMLEGFDSDTMSVPLSLPGNMVAKINYSALPPGKYILKVWYGDDSGAAHRTRLSVSVKAPWWHNPWLLFGVGLLIVAACCAMARRMAERKRRRLLKEETLLSRMRELIEQCERYESERRTLAGTDTSCGTPAGEDNDKDEEMSPADKEFLSRAAAMVERNIDEPGYSVERLSRDLCMDRTGLYRKLVGLLDKSPSLFIRSVRLRRALKIIEENPGISIAEVAALTGFSGGSYFSKCFQEEFGCRPSEYASKCGKST